ncbi:hypothetical protein DJ548_01810 [Klebsiella grimontii]|uniref:hypothetical protein n=1 Tax=Klebsiella grimontii TaxID=2058152 RepID=UPI0011E3C3DA|nr:hypothetical protein [Klebsiella grimontii]TYG10929.1 hypothetical protein DJ548_01810 [Klebsiella grimontii]DAY86978.1 MAG TPA: hypothetical protein [Caudoviricetes sp.]
MTTDITELAQREKFEAWAEERCALPWGYLKNRRTNTGYFSKHDYTSLWAAWKAAGAELVEALEKAQHVAAVDWEAAASLNVENQELKRRITELESRTVTIEPFRSFVTDADLAALHRFAECCDDPESGGHDLEKEQVRRLEAIGALQRSGRISYITGFGDVLISITAGIKWEAE